LSPPYLKKSSWRFCQQSLHFQFIDEPGTAINIEGSLSGTDSLIDGLTGYADFFRDFCDGEEHLGLNHDGRNPTKQLAISQHYF